jgi:hypothetical protein
MVFHGFAIESYQINGPKASSAKLVLLVEVPGGLLQRSVVEVGDRPEVSAHVAAEVLRNIWYNSQNCPICITYY